MDRLARPSVTALALLAAACSSRAPSGAAPSASASAPLASASSAPSTTLVPLFGPTPITSAEPVARAAPREPLTGDYRGTIEPELRVAMRLGRDHGEISGRYFYENKGLDLQLRGKLLDDGSFTLEEVDERNRVTGTFSGAVGPSGELTGSWSSPKGGRRAFHLDPVPVRAPGAPVTILKKWYRTRQAAKQAAPRNSPIGSCSMDLAHPELMGLADPAIEHALNDKLRLAVLRDRDPRNCDAPFVTNASYAVHTNKAGVLSLSFTYDTACDLCAHPSFGGAAVNVLVDTGADLPLDRLLAPGGRAKLFAALEIPVRDRIKATAGATPDDASTLRNHYLSGDYVLEDKGLRLIAFFSLPHAEQALDGDFGTLLPWSAIAAALDPKSPAAPIWSSAP